ncbi:MAG: serine hydroxymethyltransferase [Methanobrevibacter sp.]|jgi:glycine hydroxymethyltransferase|nr:serine hydroxymethyltransferase [Candidatus Methanovirga australis]
MSQDSVNYIQNAMKDHNQWMKDSINLIASENITSIQVKEALISDLSHRYAEGLVGQRLYEGCKYIDMIEEETIKLSKKLFNAEHVNVQPTSGIVANLAGFFAFSNPGDKIMALEIPVGGHISHSKVGAAGIGGLKLISHNFNPKTMNIDGDVLKKQILKEKPKIVLLGGSLFLFPHPIEEAREAADEVEAILMYDAAHVLGLIGGGEFQDPLKDGVDLIAGSTHKTFPGPQGGIILSKAEHSKKIDDAVFPGVVSNHHLHHVAGLGIATAEMLEFGQGYAKQIIKNAKALGAALYDLGFDVLCEDLGFTESHQIVLDMSNVGKASILAKEFETNNIILNKNLIPNDNVDKSDDPSGIRLGTQEVTRRGMKESEMVEIAEFFKKLVIDKKSVSSDVTDFMSQYTNIHYAFTSDEAYDYINL